MRHPNALPTPESPHGPGESVEGTKHSQNAQRRWARAATAIVQDATAIEGACAFFKFAVVPAQGSNVLQEKLFSLSGEVCATLSITHPLRDLRSLTALRRDRPLTLGLCCDDLPPHDAAQDFRVRDTSGKEVIQINGANINVAGMVLDKLYQ